MSHSPVRISFLIFIATLLSFAIAEQCQTNIPTCDDITCGVPLSVQFDNTTVICDCTDADYDVHFTECQNNRRSAFFFYKPPAVCLNGNLPAPINNIACDYVCTSGNYYNTNSSSCVACPPGAYSQPVKTTSYTTWSSIPPQFTTSCERVGSGGCNAWATKGDYIDSGNNRLNNNIRSALEYRFEVKEEYLTLSFSYQVSAEQNWDFFNFIMDDVLIFKVSQQTWRTFSINVTTGYHTAKWVYTKDPSLSFGEDLAKIRWITLAQPNKVAFFCPKCLPGEYSDGTQPCRKCPAGTYAENSGSAECTPCPPYYTSYSGAVKCYLDSVPCTTSDYYSYKLPCDPSTNNQITNYDWINPHLCNISAPGSVSLPQQTQGPCQPKTCKPGQQPNSLGFCDYCPVGQASTDGTACVACRTGAAASARRIIYDRWFQTWPSNFNTLCRGDCRSNGWRLAGDFTDSGVGNGVSDSILIFQFEIVNDTNLGGMQRSISFDYAMSCEYGSLQVSIDGFISQSIQCGGCNDLSSFTTVTIPFINPGQHVAFLNFKTLDDTSNDTLTCNRAIVRSIVVSGAGNGGGASQCQSCSGGTYSNSSISCVNCPAGTSSSSLATECTPCPANTFSPSRSSQCYPCGEGTTSNGNAAQCNWAAGTCKYDWTSKNRTFDLSAAGAQWGESTLASLDEPGTKFYLNLCGNNNYCNAINALACKYVPETDDWVNLGNAIDITATPSTQYASLMLTVKLTDRKSVV